MNLYENAATEAIASYFYYEPKWKKELLFKFFLDPFKVDVSEIKDVITQNNLKDTIPDFTIILKSGTQYNYEVKINDDKLTKSEMQKGKRQAFLIRKNYDKKEMNKIPKEAQILYWEDLFSLIETKGATNEFARLALVREFMEIEGPQKLLNAHESALLYSREVIHSIYSLAEKIINLCEGFLDAHTKEYSYTKRKSKQQGDFEQSKWGIGYNFKEKRKAAREFYIGLSPQITDARYGKDDYYFSVALKLTGKEDSSRWFTTSGWAFFPLKREILSKCKSDEELQEKFNKNVEEVIKSIK